jgi:hypothetical protein
VFLRSAAANKKKTKHMKAAVVFLVAVLISVAFASNVVDLTPDNFDSYVDGSRGAFVEFFAPWFVFVSFRWGFSCMC